MVMMPRLGKVLRMNKVLKNCHLKRSLLLPLRQSLACSSMLYVEGSQDSLQQRQERSGVHIRVGRSRHNRLFQCSIFHPYNAMLPISIFQFSLT
jgi:hypothetical protein